MTPESEPDPDIIKLLEKKLEEVVSNSLDKVELDQDTTKLLKGKIKEAASNSLCKIEADSLWPFNLDFDKMSKSTWILAVSRYQTALDAVDSLQNELAVQTEVIQDLLSQKK